MVRPLTKKDQSGNLYTRPSQIQTALDAAIQQEIPILRHRAVVSKRDSPHFIPTECLVHIIRESRRRHDEHSMSVLLLSLPKMLSGATADLEALCRRLGSRLLLKTFLSGELRPSGSGFAIIYGRPLLMKGIRQMESGFGVKVWFFQPGRRDQ
jgi:hypothetical protein